MNFFNIFNDNQKEYSVIGKISRLLLSYVFSLFLIAISFIFLKIIDLIIVENGFSSIIELVSKSGKKIRGIEPLKVIFIVPIIEELIFRLILKPSKINIKLYFIIVPFIMVYTVFINVDDLIYRYILSFLFLCLGVIGLLNQNKIREFIDKNIKKVIVISVFIFGIIHTSNFVKFGFEKEIFYVYPLFTLPQIILGYFIANMRLKFNFFWGMLLHFFINFMSLIF